MIVSIKKILNLSNSLCFINDVDSTTLLYYSVLLMVWCCRLKDLHQKCQKEMDDYVGCMYYYTNEFDLCRKEQEAFEKVCPLK